MIEPEEIIINEKSNEKPTLGGYIIPPKLAEFILKGKVLKTTVKVKIK